MHRNSIIFAFLLILTGCASVSTDPAKGGFIGGLKGVVGGEYDKRIQTKENEADELQQLNAQLKSRLQETEDDISYVNWEIGKVKEALHRSTLELEQSRSLLESEQAKLLTDQETRDRLLQEQRNMETLMLELTMMTVELEKQEQAAQQNIKNEKLKSIIKQQKAKIKKKSEEVFPQQEEFNNTIETLFKQKLKDKQKT